MDNHEDSTINKKLIYVNLSLVAITFLLVLVTAYGVHKTTEKLQGQLQEARRATKLDWRPFLTINYDDSSWVTYFGYRLSDINKRGTIDKHITRLSINNPEYLAVHHFIHELRRDFSLTNMGATPLRITRAIHSTLNEREWAEKYDKSEESLVRDLIVQSSSFLETDVVILPDSSFSLEGKGSSGQISKEQFDSILTDSKKLLLYPYTYVEYEDFFKNKYNLLYIQFHFYAIKVTDGIVTVNSSGGGVEKYRWDVLISD